MRCWRVDISVAARPARIDPTEALHHIVLVPLANAIQVVSKRFFHRHWQRRSPILVVLAFADRHLAAGPVISFILLLQLDVETQRGTG
jgi:hypothetical protein